VSLAWICRFSGLPTALVRAPGLVTRMVCTLVNEAVPFGVPRPVGPSQPVPAVHSTAGRQVPLLPDVTSKRLAGFEYG